MEELEFDLDKETCRKKFLEMRKNFRKSYEKADFLEKEDTFNSLYDEICISALEGDVIAQDFLGYLHKKGWYDWLPANIETAMKWQILSAANGNGFSIEKLTIFLSFAIDKILSVEDVEDIINRNDIFQENYQYIIGRLLCEGVVDELRIDAKVLYKEEPKLLEQNSKSMHIFEKALEEAIPRVLKFLRS